MVQKALADTLRKSVKRRAGKTSTSQTPLNVRTSGISIDEGTRRHIRSRLGRQLGKFALHIERVTTRFEDLNGPRGGTDTVCRIKIVLSHLPSIVVEQRAGGAQEAFDLAAPATERAVKRAIDKSGLRTPKRRPARRGVQRPERAESEPALARASAAGSHVGRRVGRRADNVASAAERPEKLRRDVLVDTAQPKRAASDRKVGAGATAARNTKIHSAGMTSALEDSMQQTPSRKSTRRSHDRSKPDSQLRRREMRSVRSPGARAQRANAKKVARTVKQV